MVLDRPDPWAPGDTRDYVYRITIAQSPALEYSSIAWGWIFTGPREDDLTVWASGSSTINPSPTRPERPCGT